MEKYDTDFGTSGKFFYEVAQALYRALRKDVVYQFLLLGYLFCEFGAYVGRNERTGKKDTVLQNKSDKAELEALLREFLA